MRKSNLTNEAVIAKFGQQFLETTMANAKHAISLLMLEGNEEYFNVLDKNLALVMQGNATAEEAAKRIETGWNKGHGRRGAQDSDSSLAQRCG